MRTSAEWTVVSILFRYGTRLGNSLLVDLCNKAIVDEDDSIITPGACGDGCDGKGSGLEEELTRRFLLGPETERCKRVQDLLKLVLEIDVEETNNAQVDWLMENSYTDEDEGMAEQDGSDVSDKRRRLHHRTIPMEEASDPDIWMEENHHSTDPSSSSVSDHADNSALGEMVSARDALLSLISKRLDSAERGDMEAIDELEQMQANCCL